MGILSLCFLAVLAAYGPFIGRGIFGARFEDLFSNGYFISIVSLMCPGPCQPFHLHHTKLCRELQTFVQDEGVGKFCNLTRASCNLNVSTRGPLSRKDAFKWSDCYCDELCEEIGDCCVDYYEWNAPRPSTRRSNSVTLTCRRAPSDISDYHFGYIMVGSCPPTWNDVETSRGCTSSNYSADPLTALPVFDAAMNVTYANTYCAMCHDKTRDLHLWNLRIVYPRSIRHTALRDIQYPSRMWQAIPVGEVTPDRCVATPSHAHTNPDTKIKDLCRSYANGIFVQTRSDNKIFKNPHCALVAGYNLSAANVKIACGSRLDIRYPPKMRSAIFVFSLHAKPSNSLLENIIRMDFSCSINEVYNPFKGRCMPVPTIPYSVLSNDTNKTEQCRGPHFSSNEFHILSNNSIFLRPHHKIYPNESYILVNQSLILCSNFSRNYTKWIVTPGEKEKSPAHSLALRILTYVGFSLSIISLLFLLVTYFLFAELRTYPGKKVMHLSCAMIAMQSVYFASDPDVVSSAVCAVMGALLHYFILAVFLWMSVIAHNTQKTFSNPDVNPSNPSVIAKRRKRYIRYSLLSWGFPLVVVGICVVLQLTNTGNVAYGNEDGCQLSLPARTYAVAFPVSLMLFFNIIALIRTGIAIKQLGQGNTAATNQRNLPLIVLKLTVVMGMSWILGFVLAFYPTPYIEYPFVIINSCQGVLICFSFVIKKNVFALYKQRFMIETHPAEPATTTAEKRCTEDLQP
ncbi:hypothetical protein OS493_007133 [Desmophyllum pertusum]|uniref:G-protein coupled receptors family 2 profile 2 domain-containing protein n=1 Tax=Desmophyllum pertusum TaxID=174260 RepID=A0A9X0CZ23_9CNID|nr:hypothetical protein OS493_007133 [Desmophyllum pertusum]